MKILAPLPAREPLLPDESLASLVRRTGASMGYERPGRIRSLLQETADFPAHWNHLPLGPTGRQLGDLLRQTESSILNATVHRYAPRLMLVGASAAPSTECDSKTTLKYFQSAHPPVCPLCLKEDEQPYERLSWSIRAIPFCLQHNCYLTDTCPNCQCKLRTDRCDVASCWCGFDFRDSRQRIASVPAATLLTRLDQRFHGNALPFVSVPPSAVIWWLERLCAALSKLPGWINRLTAELSIEETAAPNLTAWLAAGDILEEWPEKFFAFLDEFQQVTKHRTTATGVTRSFGLLLREASHLENLGYSFVADTLRDYLAVHYTAGHLTSKTCLFSAPKHAGLLNSRPWMSLTEADEVLHFRKGGSAALLERGILSGAVHCAKPAHRTVGLVTRESVRSVAHELKTALSVSDASQALGLGRGRVFELIKADLLPRAIWTNGGWRIPRDSIHKLLDLVNRAPQISQTRKAWLTMRQATRQFGPSGCNFLRLLELIQADKVHVGRSSCTASFQDLLVSASDLKTALPELYRMRDEESGLPLCRVATDLWPGRSVKETVLRKWIALGLLRASRAGRRWAISASDLNRFRAEFCLLKDAAQLLDIHSKTLLRWIKEGALAPVYGPGSDAGGGFHLLRRRDIDQLRGVIARHHRLWRTQLPAA